MVAGVGFEPTFSVIFIFSLSLIFAFLDTYLHAKIQAFPSYCKHYFASLCNNRKKNMCHGVSPVLPVSPVCCNQSCPVSVSDCVAGRGVESSLSAGSRKPRLGPNACESGALWQLVAIGAQRHSGAGGAAKPTKSISPPARLVGGGEARLARWPTRTGNVCRS